MATLGLALALAPMTAASARSEAFASAGPACPTFKVLASRGSGEDAGPGKPVGAFIADLQKTAAASAGTVAPPWYNPYPAVPVDPSGWKGLLVDYESFVVPLGLPIYQASVARGQQLLRNQIAAELSGPCGGSTRLILAGYSQGAETTGNVYQGLSASDQSKIFGMVLFGDTHFLGTSNFAYGNADPKRNGVFGARPEFSGSSDTLSFCHNLDPICQGFFKFIPSEGMSHFSDLAQHLNYDTVGDGPGLPTYPQLAANHFVRGAGLKPPTSAATPLDLVFVIDSTGSMGPYLSAVTANVQTIVDKTRAASPDVRFALVDFKDTDQGDPYASRVDVPFTTDTAALGSAVGGITADGGGDTPEARFSGIMTALGLPWRNGVRKEIIVMSDAPGKDPEPVTGYTAATVIDKAFSVDPAVVDTLALGGDPSAASFDPQVTTKTGGHLFVGDTGGTIADTIIKAIQTTTAAPVAAITDPGSVAAGGRYSLSAGGSFDPGGEALTYAWDLDGSGTYATTSHGPVLNGIAAGAVGDHKVALRVTDTDGLVGFATATVHVVDAGPYTGVPQAPTGISVTPAADHSTVTVSWKPGAGPPTEAYQVSTTDGVLRAVVQHGGAASLTLPAGQLPLTLQIQALNRIGLGGVAGPVYTAVSGPSVTRIAGADRFATGIMLSQARYHAGQAGAVVLARGDLYPDALAGVPLAAKKGGPLLLTSPAVLDGAVGKEIQRVLPTGGTVYVLGGVNAVSKNVENSLTGLGYHVVRFAGGDRFATALTVAQSPDGLADPSHVIVATGLNYPDALAAGPLAAGPFAAQPGQPAAVVLSQDRTLDPATAAYLKAKAAAGGQNVAAIGGQAVAAAKSVLPASAYRPLSGADRYATAASVAALFGTSPSTVGVATGIAFPDALTGGAFMAAAGGPILLTDPAGLSAPTAASLTADAAKVQAVDAFGGVQALPDKVVLAIAMAVHGIVHT
ncbi:hypothetical protein GCM10009838_01520 [Catenulispora subtropica]|uniref:VWFA domain-containing protein n=1 Tax=Catenulispora subtropica TaxID=450798 RepID=A0ABP5BRK0_9ACTN